MIGDLRQEFNDQFEAELYIELLARIDSQCGTRVEFRVAETPVFLPKEMLEEMALAGAELTRRLLAWPEYLAAAYKSIPEGFLVAGATDHPHFLTADFALVRSSDGSASSKLVPKLVELQAFPSVYAYQAMLNDVYSSVFNLPDSLGVFLGGPGIGALDEAGFWELFRQTILGGFAPENVVLTEVDPVHQKTLPDFLLTEARLGIPVVDITNLVPIGNKFHYKNNNGDLIPIHRIYNRAIADEIIARDVKLPFKLTDPWDVEWAGHPNWYFLISKYSIPWLSLPPGEAREASGHAKNVPGSTKSVIPPAVFLDEFLNGDGLDRLRATGIVLPNGGEEDEVYENLLLKPLFSFAGKGIQFAPNRRELLAIPETERKNYLLQERMHFVPTIETPHGLTQAEIRILYLWPDGGELTPVLPLVRLGRGKMMGVDHNRNQEWVGASAAFWR